MSAPDSSLSLLARARAGDAAALDALAARLLPRLRRWASGRVPLAARDMTSTDDVVQDTPIAALRNLDTFEPRHEAALNVYLRQALRRRLANEHRRARRRGPHEPMGDDDDLHAPQLSPLAAAILEERRDAYEQALLQLDEHEREAIVGRLELGCSYRELAEAWGKPSADAARKTVERAVLRLATLLGR